MPCEHPSQQAGARRSLIASELFTESRIQDHVPSIFQEFYDLLCLSRIDAHFFQSFAKVREKKIEVRIVQPVVSGPCVSIMDILACIHDLTAE